MKMWFVNSKVMTDNLREAVKKMRKHSFEIVSMQYFPTFTVALLHDSVNSDDLLKDE